MMGWIGRWWIALIIVISVAGTGAGVALNSTAMHAGGTAAGVMVSGIPAAQNGFAEGRRVGEAHASATASPTK